MLTLVIGLGVGLARGGTLSALARVHVQQPLLFATLVLVLAVGGLVPALHSVAWIVAAVLAALFAGMNNRLPGLGLLVAGIIANAAVITANGGQMPVSLWQAQHAGVPIHDILNSAFHTPAGDDTSLRLLSDIIPFAFPGVPAVLSIGDVLIAAALGVFGAVTPVRARRTLQARRNAALAGALPANYGGSGRPAGRDTSAPAGAHPGTDLADDDSWDYVKVAHPRDATADGLDPDEPEGPNHPNHPNDLDDPNDLDTRGDHGDPDAHEGQDDQDADSGRGGPDDLGDREDSGGLEDAEDADPDDRGHAPRDGDGYDPYDISVYRTPEDATAAEGAARAGTARDRDTAVSGQDDPWGDGPSPRQPGATARG